MQESNELYVVVEQVPPLHKGITPVEVQGDIVKKISSIFDRNGKPLTGLTLDEQEYILPSIINVKPESDNWEKELEKYYADISIPVPLGTPVKLNIATIQKEVIVKGQPKKVDFPINPVHYTKYRLAKVHKWVAKTEQEKENIGLGIHRFIMYDESENRKKKEAIHTAKNRLEGLYLELISKDKDNNYKYIGKINWVLRLFGFNPQPLSDIDKELKLAELKDAGIKEVERDKISHELTKFYKVINDEALKDKAFIMALVDKQILSNKGDAYYETNNPGNVLGSTIEEAVAYVRNDNNSKKVNEFKLFLQESSK